MTNSLMLWWPHPVVNQPILKTLTAFWELLQERVKGLGGLRSQCAFLTPRFPDGITVVSAFKTAPYAQPLSVIAKGISAGALEGGQPYLFCWS